MSNYKAPFPHCDSNVLHTPGKCVYCDDYPEKQQDRIANNVAFTGEDPCPPGNSPVKVPCPSELKRPLETIEKWGGNRARTQADLDELDRTFHELARLMGDS